uniref:Uncharacterized protein n=1 Tax=Oryza brachyantha TaxID=4533 RepID=J3N1N5_ORYBR
MQSLLRKNVAGLGAKYLNRRQTPIVLEVITDELIKDAYTISIHQLCFMNHLCSNNLRRASTLTGEK